MSKQKKPVVGQQMSRDMQIQPDQATGQLVDAEARTIRLPVSSETAVDCWFGTEVLSHEPGAIRLDNLRQSVLPLLFNHDRSDLLGRVVGLELGNDKRLYAVFRFGRDERGQWAMDQVNDQILVNVSINYRVFKWLEDTETETYTAMDWEPYEISLVTIPADDSVGVGRAAQIQPQTPAAQGPAVSTTGDNPMGMRQQRTPRGPEAGDGSGNGGGAAPQQITPEQAAVNERNRISEIEAMCRQHQIPDDLRSGLISRGASVNEARAAVLDQLTKNGQRQASLGGSMAPDMTNAERGSYSMIRAINASLTRNWKSAGFEREVSIAIGQRMGRDTDGFFMPTDLDFGQRTAAPLSSGSLSTGGALVATNLQANNFIELLRNQARTLSLGATVISGLVGNVDIPRQAGAATAYWVDDPTAVSESEPSFDKISLIMKTIGAMSVLYRSMLMQSTPAAEMLVRQDLLRVLALGIDAAVLYGSGADNKVPLGIANSSGVGSVIGGTNGAAITIDHLIDLETLVADANVDVDGGDLAYLVNARTVGALKKLKSSTGQYLWTNSPLGQRSGTPGEINGYTVARSNQARKNLTKGNATGLSEVFFGAWSNVVIGEWGVLEIVANGMSDAVFGKGAIQLRAMQSLDIGLRHGQAFSVMSDASTVVA
jgi:HK97 family phage major capsid protein/HK97 family phage prohead protease